MSFRHQIRVRYGECDQQGVAFNAHYMAWMDDATEVWVRGISPGGDYHAFDWEWMVVKSVIEWQSSARTADLLDIDVGVVRWGRSSFDFGFVGCVAGRPVFSGRTVAVSVKPVTLAKMDTPAAVRELLGPALDWDVPA
ncbi:MAG: acyl-CoA thioesterase [Gammaproteobacteria bacterium]|nr:acyl-CoA thioesterase [Gammaproteobacteria bacterium]MCP5198794.1 acyl-CoA thioesterase [Gammaproteobacteria bacterium]